MESVLAVTMANRRSGQIGFDQSSPSVSSPALKKRNLGISINNCNPTPSPFKEPADLTMSMNDHNSNGGGGGGGRADEEDRDQSEELNEGAVEFPTRRARGRPTGLSEYRIVNKS